MAKKTSFNPTEIQGTAFASWALVTQTIFMLRKKGAFDQSDVNALLSGILLGLEKGDLAADPAVHSARVLLSGFARELGVPTKAPN